MTAGVAVERQHLLSTILSHDEQETLDVADHLDVAQLDTDIFTSPPTGEDEAGARAGDEYTPPPSTRFRGRNYHQPLQRQHAVAGNHIMSPVDSLPEHLSTHMLDSSQVATEANVNVEEELTVAMYNNSCALKSDSNMSLTSSVYSVEHGPNSVGRRKTAVRGASRRTSLQLVKQAFVRGTAGCLFRPLKSDVDDEYAYGIPEVSNESSPEVTRTNSQLLTLSKRQRKQSILRKSTSYTINETRSQNLVVQNGESPGNTRRPKCQLLRSWTYDCGDRVHQADDSYSSMVSGFANASPNSADVSINSSASASQLSGQDSPLALQFRLYRRVLSCVVYAYRSADNCVFDDYINCVNKIFYQVNDPSQIDRLRNDEPSRIIVDVSLVNLVWPTSSSRPDGAAYALQLLLPKSCHGPRTVLLQLPKRPVTASSAASSPHTFLRRPTIAMVTPKRFEFDVSAVTNNDVIIFQLLNIRSMNDEPKSHKRHTLLNVISSKNSLRQSSDHLPRSDSDLIGEFSVAIKEIPMIDDTVDREFCVRFGKFQRRTRIWCSLLCQRFHVHRDKLDRADSAVSTELNVSNYRDLCRRIYSQLPTTEDYVVQIDTKTGEIMRLFAEYCRLTEFDAAAIELTELLRLTRQTTSAAYVDYELTSEPHHRLILDTIERLGSNRVCQERSLMVSMMDAIGAFLSLFSRHVWQLNLDTSDHTNSKLKDVVKNLCLLRIFDWEVKATALETVQFFTDFYANDDSATGAGDIGEQLDAENYYNIIHSFYSRKLTSASSELAVAVDDVSRTLMSLFAVCCHLSNFSSCVIELTVLLQLTSAAFSDDNSTIWTTSRSRGVVLYAAQRLVDVQKAAVLTHAERISYTSLLSELDNLLRAVKNDLDTEVQSLLVFPFEQATIDDAKLSDILVQLLRVLKMPSEWKTKEEKLREQKTQQFVAQIYTEKLQDDVTKWVGGHVETLLDCGLGSVIQDTLKFVDLLKQATHQLTPADHRVLEFFRQLDINCYDITSRKIDAEVYCPAFELVQRMQKYQKDYRKYESNIEDSCRASASHYVALSQLYARIVDNVSNTSSGLRLAKACMLKLASHRRWFDTIVIYGMQTFQFHLNDIIKTSVWSAVKDGISLSTVNLDYVILESLKKQIISEWNEIELFDVYLRFLGITKLTDILCDAVVLYTDTVVTMLENNGFYDFEDEQMTSQKSSSLIGSRGVADSVSRRVRQLRHLCMFISSSIKICSFLDDLPSELRWNAVLDQVSQDNGDDVDGDDGGESEKSRTALQALYHLMTSAKDDVERRIRGVMTRTVDALSVCIRRRTTAVTSPCVVPTPWHDESRCEALVTSLDEIFATLRDNLLPERFRFFPNALCEKQLQAFADTINPYQPPKYYEAMLRHLGNLWQCYYEDSTTAAADVVALYKVQSAKLAERARPSDQLMHSYYGLIACNKRFSFLYYGELLVNLRVSTDRNRSDVSVVVEVEEAKDLPSMVSDGASNTYVSVSLCPVTSLPRHCLTPQCTPVRYNTVNPSYKHTCRFDGLRSEILSTAVVLLSVWHYDPLMADTFLGEVVVLIDNFRNFHQPTNRRYQSRAEWLLLTRPSQPVDGPFATLRERCRLCPSDGDTCLLVQQRCQSVGWTSLDTVSQLPCGSPSSLVCLAWTNALVRLTGRKTEVQPSRHRDRRSFSHVESPVTPFVARLKPFRVGSFD